MNKKLTLLTILFTVLCSLFIVTGCYEPTEEDLKTFEERGWIATTEAESEYLIQLKKWANIPEDAKIEDVSMYGGKVPRVVVYGEMKGKYVKDRKVKVFNKEGETVRDDLLSWGEPSKDKEGNITAYIASDSYAGEQNKIILLDEEGNVENEKDLIHHEEKKGWKYVLKEHEQGYLSEDGNYLGVFYVKYWTDKPYKDDEPAGDLPKAIYKFQYMDKNGKKLWEIKKDENNSIIGSLTKISKGGKRILLVGVDKLLENNTKYYLALYDRNGELIKKHYFVSVTKIKLTKDDKYAIFTVRFNKNNEIVSGFMQIDLDRGGLIELKAKNWNEFNDIL